MSKLRRIVVVLAVGAAAVAASAVPALATADPGVVTVRNDDGVVGVGTGGPRQPLVGASVDTNTGRACVGFSYQVPQCAGGGTLS